MKDSGTFSVLLSKITVLEKFSPVFYRIGCETDLQHCSGSGVKQPEAVQVDTVITQSAAVIDYSNYKSFYMMRQ